MYGDTTLAEDEQYTPQQRALILQSSTRFGIELVEFLDRAGVATFPADMLNADEIIGKFDLIVAAADSVFDTGARGVEALIAHMTSVAEAVAQYAGSVSERTTIVLSAPRSTPMENSRVSSWLRNAVQSLQERSGCRAAAIVMPQDGVTGQAVAALIGAADVPGEDITMLVASADSAPTAPAPVAQRKVDDATVNAADRLSEAARAEELARAASKSSQVAHSELRTVKADLDVATSELAAVRQEAKQAAADVTAASRRLDDLRRETANLEARIAQGKAAEVEAGEALERITELRTKADDLAELAEQTASELKAMRDERRLAGVELAAERARAADSRERAERASFDATRAEIDLLNLEKRIEALMAAAQIEREQLLAEAEATAADLVEQGRQQLAKARTEAAESDAEVAEQRANAERTMQDAHERNIAECEMRRVEAEQQAADMTAAAERTLALAEVTANDQVRAAEEHAAELIRNAEIGSLEIVAEARTEGARIVKEASTNAEFVLAAAKARLAAAEEAAGPEPKARRRRRSRR